MAELDQATSSIIVDTASGPLEIAVGLPDWVTADLIAEAGGPATPAPAPAPAPESPGPSSTPPIAAESPGPSSPPGSYVATPAGLVYIPANVPDWVKADLVQQAVDQGGIQRQPAIPQGPQATTQPLPVSLPSPGIPDRTGGLSGALRDVGNAAAGLAQRAGQAIAGAAADVGGIVSNITGAVTSVINALAPTVSELALGLTSRMADLAGFIGSKVVDVTTYASTLAIHFGSALSEVFGDFWSWIRDGLLAFWATWASPLHRVYDDLAAGGLEPFL